MIVKMKLKVNRVLIAASFLLTLIAIVTSVNAFGSSRIFVIAQGDDLDLDGTKNLILGKVELGEDGAPLTAEVFFHSKIYEQSSGKVYEMKGSTENGGVLTNELVLSCPVFLYYFINVTVILGDGMLKTTATPYDVFFRKSFLITMPNSGGEYIPATIFMFLSLTGAYCQYDPTDPATPPGSSQNPVLYLPGGGIAVAGVLWYVGIPMDFGWGMGILPVGPFSSLTKYIVI